MAKIIPITINRKQPVLVDTEKLTYELPEVLQQLIEETTVQPIIAARETIRSLDEEVLAAAIGKALESVDTPNDTFEILSVITDLNFIASIKDSLLFDFNLIERVSDIIESVRNEATYNISEVVAEVQEEVLAAALQMITESVTTPIDSHSLELSESVLLNEIIDTHRFNFNVDEFNIPANDTTSLNFSAYDTIAQLLESQSLEMQINETDFHSLDSYIFNINTTESNPSLTLIETPKAISIESASVTSLVDAQVTIATLNMFANAVNSNSNWTNPTNALGNTTATAATLTASSTNLGVTNVTTTGTLVVGFRNQVLTDLTLGATAILSIEISAQLNGVILNTQPTANVTFAYSFDGTNFTTIRTVTATTAKQIFTVDIKSLIGTDYTKIDNLVVRGTGTVTSGTGLGASSTVSFFRTFLTAQFDKTY